MVNSNKPAGYVASPYGFAESTKDFYYQRLLPLVGKYITVIDPWSVDAADIFNAPKQQQPALWLDRGNYYLDTISQHATIVVAGLDQEPPDNGTIIEVAWAAAHGIPVIGYRGDFRTSGEDGLPYNMMIGAVIRRSGGASVRNLTELENELQARVSLL